MKKFLLIFFAFSLGAQEVEWKVGGFLKPTVHVSPSSTASTLWPMSGLLAGGNLSILYEAVVIKLNLEGYANIAGLGTQLNSFSFKMVEPTDYFWTAASNMNFGLHLKEAYVEFPLGDVDVRLGKQVFSWGLADGNNPTDILNPRRLGTRVTTSLDEQKMGVWAVASTWNLPNNLGTISGAWLPLSVSNDLPLSALNQTVFPGSIIPPIPKQVVVFEELTSWSFLPQDSEGGVRALFYLGPFSTSLSYATVLDRFPDFDISTSFVPLPPPGTSTTTYTPKRWRQHRFGWDFTILAEGWDFRTEGVFVLTADVKGEDIGKKNPFLNAVLQVSRSYADGLFNASLSWAPTWVVHHKTPDDYTLTQDKENVKQFNGFSRGFGQAYPFEQAISGRLAFNLLNETLKPDALLVYNVMARDYLATLSLNYNLADAINLKVGANYYGSARSKDDPERDYGPFGNVNANPGDRFYVELRYDF
jgi:hypothetical protein